MNPRRYTNPCPPMRVMHSELLAARDAHPQAQDWLKLYEAGARFEYGTAKLKTLRKPVSIRTGRTHYVVRNNPARLDEVARAVRNCPGWTGHKTPPRSPAAHTRGRLYKHRDGWGLWITSDMHHRGTVQLGRVTLHLDHSRHTITGTVPASWLVDLNVGAPELEEFA